MIVVLAHFKSQKESLSHFALYFSYIMPQHFCWDHSYKRLLKVKFELKQTLVSLFLTLCFLKKCHWSSIWKKTIHGRIGRENRSFFGLFFPPLKLGQFWHASVFRRWLSSLEQMFYSFYCVYKIIFCSCFLGCTESLFFLLFASEKYRPTALSKMMMGLGEVGK